MRTEIHGRHTESLYYLALECQCMSTSNATRTAMDAVAAQYNIQLENIAQYWNSLQQV